MTERGQPPLRPAPLNHPRINITIGGWRAFRFKWWHIVRGWSSSDQRVRSSRRQPPPLTPPLPSCLRGVCDSGTAGGSGALSPAAEAAGGGAPACGASRLVRGVGCGVVRVRHGERSYKRGVAGRRAEAGEFGMGRGENWVYANEMQMKARKLRVWECHDIAPIWPP